MDISLLISALWISFSRYVSYGYVSCHTYPMDVFFIIGGPRISLLNWVSYVYLSYDKCPTDKISRIVGVLWISLYNQSEAAQAASNQFPMLFNSTFIRN